MENTLQKNNAFPLSKVQFPKNPYTGLTSYPLGSPFSFNIPPHLVIDSQERNYIDNLWANNRNPTFPKILTAFSDYLHSKNLKNQMTDPVLRPKSLDAFFELQQTNQILSGEVMDLKQQIEKISKELEKEKNEKELLRKEWQKDIEQKEKTFEKFPQQISPVQSIIMKIIYAEKQRTQVRVLEALQEIASLPSQQSKTRGLSFCMTKYKGSNHPESTRCICTEGFSVTQATINVREWEDVFSVNQERVTINLLFELGLLKKLVLTEARQMKYLEQFPSKIKILLNSMFEYNHNHYISPFI